MWPIVRDWEPATPHQEVQAFHHQLRDWIRQLQAANPGAQLAVGGSWSSPKLEIPSDGPLTILHDMIAGELRRLHGAVAFDLCYWANMLRFGDKLVSHDHRLSHLGGANHYAAIYYVTDGLIQFGHHEPIRAKQGRMLLFPADLQHSVPPYFGDTPRLTLAFNVRIPGLAAKPGAG